MKLLTPLLIICLSAIAFQLGRGRASHSVHGEKGHESQESITPHSSDKERFDIQSEFEKRTELSASECIQALETWMQSKRPYTDEFLLYDTIARAQVETLQRISEHIAKRDDDLGREIRYVLYIRWLSIDPLSLANHYFEYIDTILWPITQDELMKTLASRAPLQALDLLVTQAKSGTPQSKAFHSLNASFYSQQHDPALVQSYSKKEKEAAHLFPAEAIAETPPTGPLKTLTTALLENENSIPKGELRNLFHQASIEAPVETYALLDKIEAPNARREMQALVLPALAKHDPILALDALYRESALTTRSTTYYSNNQTGENILKLTPSEIAQWIQSQADHRNAISTLSKLYSHTNFSSAAQLDYLLLLPKSPQRTQTLNTGITSAAQNSLSETLDWVEQNLSKHEAQSAKASIIGIAQGIDFQTKLSLFEEIEAKELRQSAAQRMVYSLSGQDLDATIDWAKSIPDAQTRAFALQALSRQWLSKDPDGAWSYLESIEEPEVRKSLESGFANTLSEVKSPEEILKSLDFFTTDLAKQSAVTQALRGLAVTNPQGAFETLLQIGKEHPETLQASVSSYAHEWSRSDPLAAAQAFWSQDGAIAESSLYPIINGILMSQPDLIFDQIDLLPHEQQVKALKLISDQSHFERNFPDIVKDARSILSPPQP